jgi:hypothetical protein
MKFRHFILSLALLAGLSGFPPSAFGQERDEVDKVVNDYLSKQKSDGADAQAQGDAVGDLNADGKPEIVLVWTQLGPTFSNNTLTVFTKTGASYRPLASFPLIGEAELSTVKGGIISVKQVVYAKNDPVCCPTVKKVGKYRLMGKKILEVKR